MRRRYFLANKYTIIFNLKLVVLNIWSLSQCCVIYTFRELMVFVDHLLTMGLNAMWQTAIKDENWLQQNKFIVMSSIQIMGKKTSCDTRLSLRSPIFWVRRKYWNHENFRLPDFHGIAHFPHFYYLSKISVCLSLPLSVRNMIFVPELDQNRWRQL